MTTLVVTDSLAQLPTEWTAASKEYGLEPAILTLGEVPKLNHGGESKELLTQEQSAEAADLALSLAEEWTPLARDGQLQGDELRAALIASSSKLDTMAMAQSFLRSVEAVRAAVTTVKPARTIWRSSDRAFAEAVAAAAGVERLTVAAIKPPRRDLLESLVKWSKVRRVDWTVRYLATLPKSWRSMEARKRLESVAASGNPPVLALFDVRNSGMIDNLAAVAVEVMAQGVPCIGLYMEPRVADALGQSHPALPLLPLSAFGKWSTYRDALGATGPVRRTVARLTKFGIGSEEQGNDEPSPSNEASPGEPTVLASARTYLASRYTWPSVAQGLVDLAALQAAIDAFEPRALVTSSDAHRYSRLAVLYGAHVGTRSLVVQHGAPVGARVYTPVTADLMAAWGPWCVDWFVKHGVAPRRVIGAGYPRGFARAKTKPAFSAVSSMLFAAQPIAADITVELLARAFVVLGRFPELRLVVRPHPGDSERGLLQGVVDGLPHEVGNRVSISAAGTPLLADLEKAEVVLSSESTVGIDALSHGTQLILLTHPALRRAIPFVEFGACSAVANADELAQALVALENPQEARRQEEGAKRFLEAYVGPVGAQAASNVANSLLEAG